MMYFPLTLDERYDLLQVLKATAITHNLKVAHSGFAEISLEGSINRAGSASQKFMEILKLKHTGNATCGNDVVQLRMSKLGSNTLFSVVAGQGTQYKRVLKIMLKDCKGVVKNGLNFSVTFDNWADAQEYIERFDKFNGNTFSNSRNIKNFKGFKIETIKRAAPLSPDTFEILLAVEQ